MRFSPQPFAVDWREEDAERRWGERISNTLDIHENTPSTQAPSDLDTWLARAIGGHVAWVMRQGVTVRPQVSADLDTPFLEALRALEENPSSTPAQINVGRYFVEAVDRHGEDAMCAQQAHRSAVDYIMTGDIPNLGVKDRCRSTGAELEYGFQQWRCEPLCQRTRRPGMSL